MITDAAGIPLAVTLTGGNRNRGYDHDTYRRLVRGITPHIARRNTGHGSFLN